MGAQCDKATGEMVQRYWRLLVVLVHPFSVSMVDDGIQIVMSAHAIEQYTELCRRALRLLDVPFLDLWEKELTDRVHVLQQALQTGTLPSPLATLEHFENLSSKKVDMKRATHHYRDVNFPFDLVHANSKTPGALHLPSLTLTASELHQSFLLPEPGKTNCFLEKNGSITEVTQVVSYLIKCFCHFDMWNSFHYFFTYVTFLFDFLSHNYLKLSLIFSNCAISFFFTFVIFFLYLSSHKFIAISLILCGSNHLAKV